MIKDLKSIYENTEVIPMKQMEYIVAVIEYQNFITATDLEGLLFVNFILNESIKYN